MGKGQLRRTSTYRNQIEQFLFIKMARLKVPRMEAEDVVKNVVSGVLQVIVCHNLCRPHWE